MTEMFLLRKWLREECAIGVLTLGNFSCYTLEDRVRPPGVKVQDRTAIPEGRYRVIVNYSPRFGKNMPRLLGVPMFDGILIHAGNTARDTRGCILVGVLRGMGAIYQSRVAFAKLLPLILAAQPDLWIEVRNEPESDTRKGA